MTDHPLNLRSEAERQRLAKDAGAFFAEQLQAEADRADLPLRPFRQTYFEAEPPENAEPGGLTLGEFAGALFIAGAVVGIAGGFLWGAYGWARAVFG